MQLSINYYKKLMKYLLTNVVKNIGKTAKSQNGRLLTVFSSKDYDEKYFKKINNELPKERQFTFEFIESQFNHRTAKLIPKQSKTVICFVNDKLDAQGLDGLKNSGVDLIALRCAGFNNVDLPLAEKLGISIVRVPAYSPHAVAEHTIGLVLALNRRIHKAYTRTRENNFSLQGLIGFDLYGKTAGIIGFGKIGQQFAKICNGFGMKVLAFDDYIQNKKQMQQKFNTKLVKLDELLSQSDIISLHCPLTSQTQYIISKQNLAKIKKGSIIVNTGRGALINTKDVIEALEEERLGGLALDVYEQQEGLFFSDHSANIVKDKKLAYLLSLPNVLLTSHQAFLTDQALRQISMVTLKNIDEFRRTGKCQNFVKKSEDSGKKDNIKNSEKGDDSKQQKVVKLDKVEQTENKEKQVKSGKKSK